jgi:hypothetical protein
MRVRRRLRARPDRTGRPAPPTARSRDRAFRWRNFNGGMAISASGPSIAGCRSQRRSQHADFGIDRGILVAASIAASMAASIAASIAGYRLAAAPLLIDIPIPQSILRCRHRHRARDNSPTTTHTPVITAVLARRCRRCPPAAAPRQQRLACARRGGGGPCPPPQDEAQHDEVG